MTAEVFRATVRTGGSGGDGVSSENADGCDVPGVPPSVAVAVSVAILCGSVAYEQSPAVAPEVRTPSVAATLPVAEEQAPAAWEAEREGFRESDIGGLAMEVRNAGAAEGGRL